MQEIWFEKAKDKDQREKVQQDFALAFNAFRRLERILERKKRKYSSDYDMANWAYQQADTNGYNRAIAEVLNLIKEESK